MRAQEILAFWFDELRPEQWWRVDPALDAEIRRRFEATHASANRGELWRWRDTAQGRLAEVIVLDQFSRNMFRGTARAFATDPQAREVTRRALARGFDAEIAPIERGFIYLPLMHSEALADQEDCVRLYRQLGNANSLKYAEDHRDIVQRFGHFPHRNPMLGRTTSAEEQAFLDGGGFAG